MAGEGRLLEWCSVLLRVVATPSFLPPRSSSWTRLSSGNVADEAERVVNLYSVTWEGSWRLDRRPTYRLLLPYLPTEGACWVEAGTGSGTSGHHGHDVDLWPGMHARDVWSRTPYCVRTLKAQPFEGAHAGYLPYLPRYLGRHLGTLGMKHCSFCELQWMRFLVQASSGAINHLPTKRVNSAKRISRRRIAGCWQVDDAPCLVLSNSGHNSGLKRSMSTTYTRGYIPTRFLRRD